MLHVNTSCKCCSNNYLKFEYNFENISKKLDDFCCELSLYSTSYYKKMQRHKEPLNFSESPYEGTRHFTSPVFGANRPFLTSTISAELLSAQWVRLQ